MNTRTIYLIICALFVSLTIHAQDHTICANQKVKLHAGNHQEGSLQWQVSYDNANWKDIDNANEITYEFQPKQSAYYRVLNKFAYCEPNASPTSLVLVKPTAVTSKNRTINAKSTSIVGNTNLGATSSWTILEGANGVLDTPDDYRSTFTGELGKEYKLLYKLENQCGISTDTLNLKLEMPQTYNKIVLIDDTDTIVSTPEQLENGEYIITFNDPIPFIDTETILVSIVDFGFMRRVANVSQNGNTFQMTTTQAALKDIITSGTIDLSIDDPNPELVTESRNGKLVYKDFTVLKTKPTRYQLLNDPIFKQNKKFIYLGDSFSDNPNTSTTSKINNESLTKQESETISTYNIPKLTFKSSNLDGLEIVLDGDFSITPNFIFETDPSTNYAKLGFENLKYTFNPTLNFNIAVGDDINFEETKLLGRKFFPVFIGAVPVGVIAADIEFVFKAEAQLQAGSVDFTFSQKGNANAFLEHKNNRLNSDFDHSSTSSLKPTVNFKPGVSATLSLGPRFIFWFNAVAAGYIDLKFVLGAESAISTAGNTSLNADLSVKTAVGVKAKFMNILKYDRSVDFTLFTIAKFQRPGKLEYISGNNQFFNLNSPLQKPFVVKATDTWGFGVPNRKVYFEAVNNAGQLSQSVAFTNSSGIAEVDFTPEQPLYSFITASVKDSDDKDIKGSPFVFVAHQNATNTCENSSLYANIVRNLTTIQPKGNLGTPPYTYSTDGINFNATAPIITTTGDNVYNFTVKDANNCIAFVSHQGAAFSCDDSDLGVSATILGNTIKAEGYGGTPPYQYALVNHTPTFGTNNTFSNVSVNSWLLRVKDANNCLQQTVVEITNPSTQLIAYFEAPTSVAINQSIKLNNYSNNATSYSWNFGNGQTSTAEHPSISYANNGTYIITLTASNGTTNNDYTRTIIIGTGQSNPFGIVTVPIPAGTFIMGSPTTEPNRNSIETQHQVTLSAFTMSKYEITCAQYAAFLNAVGVGSNRIWAAGPYPTQNLITADSTYGLTYTSGQWVPTPNKANAPMVHVNWFGAASFAQYAGGRLPTESEWEYAARGGTTTAFHTGACLNNTQANYNWGSPQTGCTNTVTTYPGNTQTVGLYPANAYGLHDMHGNAWEWCADWFGTYPTAATTNPTGPTTGSNRVGRGGGWYSIAQGCRSAGRNGISAPTRTGNNNGFRLVF